MADSPITALLRQMDLTDAQRSGLWNLYKVSTNRDDLAERLKPLQLPDEMKSQIWRLKASEAEPGQTREPATVVEFPQPMQTTTGTRIMPPVGEKDAEPNLINKVVQMGEGLARPKSVGDVLSLVLPTEVTPAIRGTVGAVKEAVQTASTLEGSPRTKAFRAILQNAINPPTKQSPRWADLPLYEQMQKTELLAPPRDAAIAERLASIPGQSVDSLPSVKRAAEVLADDVALIREHIGMKMPPETALRIVANKDKGYYEVLKRALVASIKQEGFPPPKAVSDLMKLPAFQRLPK